jgi:hypothetical protein
MTHQKNDTQDKNESQMSFEAMLRKQLQQAVRTALISVLVLVCTAKWGLW